MGTKFYTSFRAFKSPTDYDKNSHLDHFFKKISMEAFTVMLGRFS